MFSETPTVAGRIQCDSCGRVVKVGQDMINRKVRCKCGHSFRVVAQKFLAVAGSTPEIAAPGSRNAGQASRVQSLNRNGKRSGGELQEPSADDVKRVQAVRESYSNIIDQLSRTIVGQREVIEQVLIAMFSRGHVLLVGVPGLAKTLLVSSISKVLDLRFRRIQFTPDLMPSDITGTEVLQEDRTTGQRNFQFVEGPVFANMVLADEINRAPPKTQAALLEAMQERQVTIGDQTMDLPAPFLVMATQNPIEQEGTYALPEAQLDRFLFNITVDYPAADEEFDVIRQATTESSAVINTVLDGGSIEELQQTVRRIPVADHVIAYARDLVQATRPMSAESPKFIKELVGWGAGPRAGISLIMAAKARAVLYGRFHATTEDVKQVVFPVLRHRVVTTFNAEAAGVKRDDIISMLLEHVQPQRGGA